MVLQNSPQVVLLSSVRQAHDKSPQVAQRNSLQMADFINSIRILRQKREYKQKELAYILNKKSSLVSKWEKGITFPNLENAFKLAIALSTPVEFVFKELFNSLKVEIMPRKDYVCQKIVRNKENGSISSPQDGFSESNGDNTIDTVK
ncbi:helix-turn-helix transcriptional regulator [Candidatus Desantisbacteria bacterium]|nr:helix-turn-helix transcriptional regulator [Candidatus Desantisbacteria bacterium]